MTTTIAATRVGSLIIGGVEIDDASVRFFDMWRREPIYHRHGSWPINSEKWEVDATACGLATWNGKSDIGQVVPTVHAEKIGRPCLRCFPEAREAVAYKREVYDDADE